MKKILTVLLVLVVACGLFAASGDVLKTNSSLKIKYLKSESAAYGLDWFAEQALSTQKTEGNFNDAQGSTQDVTAYLKVVKNFSDVGVKIQVSNPALADSDAVDTKTIKYSATIASVGNNVFSNLVTTLPESSTNLEIARMPAAKSDSLVGNLKFVFSPNSTDISSATVNVNYVGNVTVSMISL